MKDWIKSFFSKPRAYNKSPKTAEIREIPSTTAYQRGIKRGKQLERKRIMSVLKSEMLGEHPTLKEVIGYVRFFND